MTIRAILLKKKYIKKKIEKAIKAHFDKDDDDVPSMITKYHLLLATIWAGRKG